MYVILSHPAYDNRKFKAYASIPAPFRSNTYPPQILTVNNTLEALYETDMQERWRGEKAFALSKIDQVLGLGGNPLIVAEESIIGFNPKPLENFKFPRKILMGIYFQILDILDKQPEYKGLFSKVAAYVAQAKDSLDLTEAEHKQLRKLLRINIILDDQWNKPVPKPEQVFSEGFINTFDENLETEVITELSDEEALAADKFIIEQLGFDPETIKPSTEPRRIHVPSHLYFGVDKSDLVLRSSIHDKMTHRKHRKKQR